MDSVSKEQAKSPHEIESGIKSIQTVTFEPFAVLPKEIYLEIFKRLDNPIDKQNFMNSHVKLHILFGFKRKLFLFEPVLMEVINSGFDIGPQDAFNFRLVCHAWDLAVQNHFQLHPTHFKLDNLVRGPFPRLKSEWMPKRFIWRTAEDLENDLEKFIVTHPPSKNPFLSRSITLLWQNWQNAFEMREIWEYRASVASLLDKYGEHIWHCKIIIEGKILPETCRLLPKWLSLMPELKTLELTYSGALLFSFHPKDKKGIEGIGIVQPEMNKLVYLKSSYLPATFFNSLFGNLKTLEKLRISVPNWNKFVLKDFVVPTKRESLKEAFFTLKGVEDFEHLYSAEPFPNLKVLVLALRHADYRDRDHHAFAKWPGWNLTWSILEEKFPALEQLTLTLPKAVLAKDKMEAINQSLKCTLNLQHLTKLWLVLPNVCSIDFLLPCKSLQELSIFWECNFGWTVADTSDSGDDGKWAKDELRVTLLFLWGYLRICPPTNQTRDYHGIIREKVKFSKEFTTMWDSNIWVEFPKLRLLEISASRKEASEWVDFYRYEKAEGMKKYESRMCKNSFLII